MDKAESRTMDKRQIEFVERYFDQGLLPIPLAYQSKEPPKGTKWREVTREKATREQVLSPFRNNGRSNVGLVCGEAGGGLVVLDFDNRLNAQNFLDANPELAQSTPVVSTAQGVHVYLRCSAPVRTRQGNSALRKEFGLDIKGEGSYVVAPPSIHPSGTEYRFGNGATEILTVPDFDGWLRERLEPLGLAHLVDEGAPSRPMGAQNRDGHWVARVLTGEFSEGERNATLTRLAGYLRNKVPEDVALSICHEWNRQHCCPPLGGNEVETCLLHKYAAYEGKGPSETRRYEAITLDELAAREDLAVRWCVEGLIPQGGRVVLVGDPGVGKTWLLASLALCVASGEPWLGHFGTVRAPVVVVDEENHLAVLKERYAMLAKGHGLPMSSDVQLVTGQGLDLCKPENVDALLDLLWEIGPGLLILDSYLRVHSANENSAQEMAAVQRTIGEIASQIGCAVVIAHHTRKFSESSNRADQRVRGSSDIVAFIDTLLSVSKVASGMRVRHIKSRTGPELPAFDVVLVVEDDGATLTYQGEVPDEQDGKAERAEVIVLDLLGEGPRQRQELIEAGEREKLSPATLENALSRLKKTGRVESNGSRPATYSLIT